MKIKIFLVLFILVFIIIVKFKDFKSYKNSYSSNKNKKNNKVYCLDMYYAIEKYSKIYNIPNKYLYRVAYLETGYRGINHLNYNPKQVSSVGALGAMQIMPKTANYIWNENIPKEKLINDVYFNVETAAKLLRRLYLKYKNWEIVFGYYNTGLAIKNKYAERVIK